MNEIKLMSKISVDTIKEFVTRIGERQFLFFAVDNIARAYSQALQCLAPLEQLCSKWELNEQPCI